MAVAPAQAADELVNPPSQLAARLRVAVVALLAVIGVFATALAWWGGNAEAKRNDDEVVTQAEAEVQRTAEVVSAGLAGISAAVRADGTVDDLSFSAYVREALPASTLSALAYEPVVPEAERAAFEAAIGRPITDRSGSDITTAPDRPIHIPVKQVAPAGDEPSPLLGFDIAGDPVRLAAAERARDTGSVVFSEPVLSEPSGSVSFFVVKALYRPGLMLNSVEARQSALVGYVSTAYIGSSLLDRMTEALPARTRVSVNDGDIPLGSTPRAPGTGSVRAINVLNRVWTLHVDDPRGPSRGPVWAIGLATVAVLLLLGYLLRRAKHHDEMIAGAARRAALLATLAQELSAAMTEAEVAEIATTLGRTPVQADATSVGVVEGSGLRVHHGATVPSTYRDGPDLLPLDGTLAFTEAARAGEVLIFEDDASYRARFPRAGGPPGGARAMLPLRRTDGTTIGAMAHLWNGPRRLDGAELATLRTISDLVGQAIERSRLALAQAEDARHTEQLARLAQGLAVRTNSDAVMAFLTQEILAPLDAVHAAVGVIEGDELRRHYTPGPLTEVVVAHLPETVPLSMPSPLTDAARTGEAVFIPDHHALQAAYPHMEAAWQQVGFGSTANVPLRDRTGSIIGALGVAWSGPRVFDGELRDRLATVAGIAGQTLERAELADQIQEDARRSEALAELAAVLAAARTSNDVAAAIAAEAAAVVGAFRANVALYGVGADRTVYLHHPEHTPAAIRTQFPTLDPDVPTPHQEVLRQGGIMTFPTWSDLLAAYPDLAPQVEGMEGLVGGGSAVVALSASNGLRLGAIGFVWDRPVDFDPILTAGLRNVADLCGQALERSQLSDAEHRLVTSLQDSVLVPLPRADGLATSGRYLPAARSVGMGGDWYEGIVLEDGRYITVVGDIAGHGITAVGKMAQLRSVIGALATLDTPLDELFPLATTVGPVHDLTIASAVVASIDPASATLTYACAGHPPPILRLPSGEVVVLEDGRQPLLGIPMSARAAGHHPFPIGSTLVCYTDGLVERRGETIDESVARLAAIVAEIGPELDAEELADAILLRCVPNRDQTDDVALVVVTSTG
jgi:GAF domain-containing protein/CHASE1-domain containing sensor protein